MDLSSEQWKRSTNTHLEHAGVLSLLLTLPDCGCLFGSNWEEGVDVLSPER